VVVEPGDLIVVGFSGGPDSTALLCGLARLAPERRLRLLAAHLDHGLDAGSAGRAEAARRLAGRLGVECAVARREVAALAAPGESPEAAARRVRYRFLEEVRSARRGRWIATAHHRDDQAETVLLRLLQGSGLEGLAGIQPVRGRVVRPLLELSRSELEAELAAALEEDSGDPLDPVLDPTNHDLRIPRIRVRRALLPALEAAEPGAAEALARLAGAARRGRAVLDRRLEVLLEPIGDPEEGRATVLRDAFEALPEPLRPHALALLERRAGALYPASRASREELARQLAAPGASRVGCDLAGGWRWQADGPLLTVFRAAYDHEGRDGSARRGSFAPEAPAAFSYRLPLPGEVEIPELGVTVRARREPVAPWMFRGSPRRAALALPAAAEAVVRSRLPGDRLRPLGAPGTRKLKEVLIDRGVPRRERDRLPLLLVGGRIAWVPGVTVDEAFRLPAGPPEDGSETWTVEVIP
jgi:tRNA(Ile)-lysidine synthase